MPNRTYYHNPPVPHKLIVWPLWLLAAAGVAGCVCLAAWMGGGQ